MTLRDTANRLEQRESEVDLDRLRLVRSTTLQLVDELSDADATVQSMTDASPAKWHIGHTTWFFEAVVLQPYVAGYQTFDNSFHFIFNSYYEALGPRHLRHRRGMLTRPSLERIIAYRAHVDEALDDFMSAGDVSEEVWDLIELGMNHEQQHQELLLTDILHLFSENPLRPEYRASGPLPVNNAADLDLRWISDEGGIKKIGHDGSAFAFDCEGPRHDALIHPFKIASRPASNRDWMAFMNDGGYDNSLLWLSDGWATAQAEQWKAPLYWEQRGGAWWTMTLRGFQPVNEDAPVSHISYFEADAFARWSGHRLPTEFEWETVAAKSLMDGNFANSRVLRPIPAKASKSDVAQLFGDIWEWTCSPYAAYPGFKPNPGVTSEYNGKFMSGQYILRGGSCVTPATHIRPTYRNFFYPHQRWQFSGVRLGSDA